MSCWCHLGLMGAGSVCLSSVCLATFVHVFICVYDVHMCLKLHQVRVTLDIGNIFFQKVFQILEQAAQGIGEVSISGGI